jgi:hypothetical protein
VGEQECREIEQARCEAARSCDFGIDSNDEFETCERYARDNCLHGLVTKDTPSSSELSACVREIRQAGVCASEGKPLASACGIATVRLDTKVQVCEIVQDPEEAESCTFLLKEEPTKETPPATKDAGGD